LGPTRAVMMASLDSAIKSAERHSNDTAAGQNDIFGSIQKSTEEQTPLFAQNVREWNETERLTYEKESLGFYLGGHPITPYLFELAQLTRTRLADIRPTENKQTVRVAGWVTEQRTTTNKRGRMAFLTLDDSTGRLEVKVYSELYPTVHELLVKDTLLVVEGEVRADDYSGGYAMTATNMFTLEYARATLANRLEITVSAQQTSPDEFAPKLVSTLTPHRQGRCIVLIHYHRQDAQAQLVLGEQWRVKPNAALLEQLKELVGEDKVKVIY
ncbi:MAG: DNA polymerase III subunit alpha, partial [Candidatus Parabeggiatoa sp. nov. 1]